jgi:cold shock CspA family protein
MAGAAQKKSGDGGADVFVLDASVEVKWFTKKRGQGFGNRIQGSVPER